MGEAIGNLPASLGCPQSPMVEAIGHVAVAASLGCPQSPMVEELVEVVGNLVEVVGNLAATFGCSQPPLPEGLAALPQSQRNGKSHLRDRGQSLDSGYPRKI